MKFCKPFLFLAVSFVVINNTSGQRNCEFKIDTAKILVNKNLDSLLSEFQNDSFKITNNISDIPWFIKKNLNCLTHGFSIANTGKSYQPTDVITKRLPKRQLIFLAKSKTMLVMTYFTGGLGLSRHVLMIKFKAKKIIDFQTCSFINGMSTKEDIINNLKQNRNKERELHNGKIYFTL